MVISYLIFCQKLGKMSQNLSSAAAVIGALRVKLWYLFRVFRLHKKGKERKCNCDFLHIVGEPKSRIVQKHTFFAPERYTAGILYNDSLNSA